MIFGGLAGKLFFWLHCLYLYVEFEAIKNVFLGVPIPLMGIYGKPYFRKIFIATIYAMKAM